MRNRNIGLEEVGVGARYQVLTPRIVIIDRPDIEGGSTERLFKASDEVDFLVGTSCDVIVDRGAPGAEIEARFVADGDAALNGKLFVSLRNAAEAIVADHGGAAIDGKPAAKFGSGCRSGRKDGKGDGGEAGKEGVAH